MSITWVPVHGKAEISPYVPLLLTAIALIQRRPYSPAKYRPSSACGNFTAEFSAAS
jgi:hypothetical protein